MYFVVREGDETNSQVVWGDVEEDGTKMSAETEFGSLEYLFELVKATAPDSIDHVVDPVDL